KPSSPARPRMQPISARPPKPRCETPSRGAKTNSRLNWRSAALFTPCKPRRTANSAGGEANMPIQTQASPIASPIGRDTVRVDGPQKVTGVAQYTSDFHFPGMLYAVPVGATIAKGRIAKLDAAIAGKMPGVVAILHRGNIGKIFRSIPGPGFSGICEERRPPFEDDVVRYYGQYIALAVAGTFETAKAAADAVVATYAAEQPNVDLQLVADDEPDEVMTTFGSLKRLESERGDPDTAFASAPVKLDFTYVTPFETHNPMEPHSTTAVWEGSTLTLYESSQGVVNLRSVLAQVLG